MDELDKLLQTDREFSSYSMQHGASEAFAKYLTNDALQLPNHNQPIFGVNKIAETMKGDYTLTWEPQNGKVSSSGDLGYTWGNYTLKLTNGEVEKGKYLNIWAKENNEWRVIVDMGNMS